MTTLNDRVEVSRHAAAFHKFKNALETETHLRDLMSRYGVHESIAILHLCELLETGITLSTTPHASDGSAPELSVNIDANTLGLVFNYRSIQVYCQVDVDLAEKQVTRFYSAGITNTTTVEDISEYVASVLMQTFAVQILAAQTGTPICRTYWFDPLRKNME